MKGLARIVRRAILTRLKAHSGLLALVPAAQIHSITPISPPTWPFVKMGPPSSTPLKGACLDGATVTTAVHAFARARKSGDDTVETAEDHASRIGAEIERALDDKGETIAVTGTDGARLRYRLTDMQLLVDEADSDAFHYFCNVEARVVAS